MKVPLIKEADRRDLYHCTYDESLSSGIHENVLPKEGSTTDLVGDNILLWLPTNVTILTTT